MTEEELLERELLRQAQKTRPLCYEIITASGQEYVLPVPVSHLLDPATFRKKLKSRSSDFISFGSGRVFNKKYIISVSVLRPEDAERRLQHE